MDRPSSGLITALNKMREMSVEQNSIYHQYVEPVTDATTIGEFGQPILDTQNLNVMNDFVSLMKKIVAVAVHTRTFNNPLAQLEGEEMPLGEFIEDVAVNPADANVFNVNDFGGLLEKYSAQVATQYLGVNSDLQYKVTITRDKIRNAFTSWNQLEKLFTGIVNSLYNGAYLQRYNDTRALVLGAYKSKSVPITLVDAVTDEATAKALTQKIRADFSKMQVPSTNYNGWNLVKTDKEFSLKTWADPEDMVVLVSADVDAINVVQNLSRAFNIDEAMEAYERSKNDYYDTHPVPAGFPARSCWD